jgi:hemerythrin-like domain-containing protein
MLPIGPLMIEHRLIERMIAVIKKELVQIEKDKRVNPSFIDTAVDFIRTYADRCHHGKEEDILFRDLKKKSLSDDHLRILKELIEEHQWARKTTARIIEGKECYLKGEKGSLDEIVDHLSALIEFYPKHIQKEDKHFFIPVMKYFSQDEKEVMLKEGYEFDKKLIHEKYENMVSQAEKKFANQTL